jgi:hypothetical protein
MTEFDVLETELAAMRPRQPSDELKTRIAERLASSPPRSTQPPSRRVQRRVAMIGGLMAACLAAIVIWRELIPGTEHVPPQAAQDLLVARALDLGSPSVWSYRKALTYSSDSLAELLDQHSIKEPGSNGEHVSVHAFARFDSNINDLLGEP